MAVVGETLTWAWGGGKQIPGKATLRRKGVTQCFPKCVPRNTNSITFPLERAPGQVSLRNTGFNTIQQVSPGCCWGLWLCVWLATVVPKLICLGGGQD